MWTSYAAALVLLTEHPQLLQLDRRWKCMRTGKPYHGEAIAPSNLSIFERLIGQGKVSVML